VTSAAMKLVDNSIGQPTCWSPWCAHHCY